MKFFDTEVLDDLAGATTYSNDMVTWAVDDDTFLSFHLGTSRSSGMDYTVFALDSRGGVREVAVEPSENQVQGSATLPVETGAGPSLFIGGKVLPNGLTTHGIVRYAIDADGLSRAEVTTEGFGDAFGSGTDDLAAVEVKGRTYLSAMSETAWQIATFRVRDDGSLKPTQMLEGLFDSPAGTNFLGRGALLPVGTGNKAMIASVGYDNAPIMTHRMTKGGALKALDTLEVDNLPGFMNNLLGAEVASVKGTPFVILRHDDLGLLTYRITKRGEIVPADQIGDSPEHPMRELRAIEVVPFEDDRVVVLVGGESNAVSAFEMLETGALVHVGTLDYGAGYRETRDLASAVIDGERLLYATTSFEETLRAYRLDLDDDPLAGTKGKDRIAGGDAPDVIYGLNGKDKLKGGAGDDGIVGGKGRDKVFGGDGDDHLAGSGGGDRIRGGAGDDWAYGDSGRDRVFGDDGDDRLVGGGGADLLSGGAGRDDLYGENGSDRLDGGEDDDRLFDGQGSDDLTGGPGADTFVMTDDGATDRILDFEDGSDLIDLSAEGEGLRYADLDIGRDGDGVRIAYGNEAIRVTAADGVLTESQFTFGDFVFA